MRQFHVQRLVAVSFAVWLPCMTIASAAQPAATQSFVDVSQADWYAPYIQAAVNRGFADGYKDQNGFPNGYFGPANRVTYAEALSMIMRMAHVPASGVPKNQSAIGSWAAPYVATAETMGLSVYGTGLNVHTPISRGAVAQTIMEVTKLSPPRGYLHYTDLPETHMYYAAVESLAEAGIMKGNVFNNTISPDSYINRAEICKILSLLSGSVRSSVSAVSSDPSTQGQTSSVSSISSSAIQISGYQRIVKQPINVRAGMGMEYKSLLQLPAGAVVNYIGDAGVWSKIQTMDGVDGYVIGKYLLLPAGYVPTSMSSSLSSFSTSSSSLSSDGHQWIISHPVKVRADASMNNKSLFELPTGTVVEKIESVGQWAHIQLFDGRSGYIVEKYLSHPK